MGKARTTIGERLLSCWRALLPRPRRPFQWKAIVPLLVFAALLAGVLGVLTQRHVILFTEPQWFYLLLALPWMWWLHETGYSGIQGARAQIALFIRLALTSIFVMLLAQPRAVRSSDALALVYALDYSDSISGDASDGALEYIVRTALEKPEKDEAGLIVFGREAAVELPPRIAFPFEAINSRVTQDGTNLEKGLSLASAMIPDSHHGRIVLISDGTATAGNLTPVLDELAARKIPVDVLPVEYAFEREVWLEKLELPQHVKIGETYEAAVILSSLKAGRGRLVLEENGQEIVSQEVEFKAGKNRITMPIYLRLPGYYEYVARIEVPKGEDGWQRNNVAINYLYLQGKGKVLLVNSAVGDLRDSDSLAKAIRLADRELEIQQAFEFPRDAMSLMPYDCIIFNNVGADEFDIVQMQAVRDAVYNQGTGFLMVGGANSFGPGGYHHSPVEEALPVDMDVTARKVLPKGALAIILHTCEFPKGNTWGKRIAKAAIKVLGAEDEVGLLAWEGGEKWIFPLTPAGDYDELARAINACTPGDMPSFVGTMKLGLAGLKASDAAAKHMIIISDGDPQLPPKEMVQEYVDNRISITTVLVDGFHQGSFQQGMRAIAMTTGGRFHYPQNPNQLPRIFVKEAKTLKKSMIQEKTFNPVVEFNDGTVLKGIRSMPPLHGYVLTSPKEDSRRCTVLLRGPDKDQVDPVLAIGRFGIGKSAAFTSDLSPRWARDWMGWEQFEPFLKQLLVDISRVAQSGSLRMSSYAAGNTGVVVLEDYHPDSGFLEIAGQVAGPRDQIVPFKMKQVGHRRYQGQFPLWGKGRYQVVTAAMGDERSEQVVGGFVVPYSAEYLRFRANSNVLADVAARTGGRILDGSETGEQLYGGAREPRRVSRPVFDIFLLILVLLLPLDVAIRRVQIDFYVVRQWFRKERDDGESTTTMSALLQRKRQIAAAEEATAPVNRPQAEQTEVRAPAKTQTKSAPSDSRGTDSDATDRSTTGKLLDMKRKRQQK